MDELLMRMKLGDFLCFALISTKGFDLFDSNLVYALIFGSGIGRMQLLTEHGWFKLPIRKNITVLVEHLNLMYTLDFF